MKEKIRAETIRVLIKTTGYTSNYHESVTLTANRAFHVHLELLHRDIPLMAVH